jgi:hypothetical protein
MARGNSRSSEERSTPPGPHTQLSPTYEVAKIVRSNAGIGMIRKLKSGQYRLYSHKKNPRTGKRRNLGTFRSRKAAEAHERAVQYFKRHVRG